MEDRFGGWARTYAVICYLLTQVARTGAILYLVALGLAFLRSPFHGFMTTVIGTLTILLVGVALSRLFPREQQSLDSIQRNN